MRLSGSCRVILLLASSILSAAGCSERVPDGPEALKNSLEKIENARKVSELNRQASASPVGLPLLLPPTEPMLAEVGDQPQQGTFIVKVESSAGDFTIEVHRDWAPIGAARFYQLIKAGYYDECRYFRVVPGFMVQFGMNGDPAVQKKWDDKIIDDAVTQSNERGYVTFATSGPDSRTTQIFINFGNNASLDGQGFAPFGQIIDGMDNVDAIESKHGESPDQGKIKDTGNEYLQQKFPDLDFVKKMSIVSETAE